MVTKPCVSSSGNFPESTHHMKIAGTSQMITMIDIRALVYSPVDEKNWGLFVSGRDGQRTGFPRDEGMSFSAVMITVNHSL